jgi:hypothetical protein
MGTHFTQCYSTVSGDLRMCMLILAHTSWGSSSLATTFVPLSFTSASSLFVRSLNLLPSSSEAALDRSIVSDGSRIWNCRPDGFTYLTPVWHTTFCLSQAIGVFSLTYSTWARRKPIVQDVVLFRDSLTTSEILECLLIMSFDRLQCSSQLAKQSVSVLFNEVYLLTWSLTSITTFLCVRWSSSFSLFPL